MFSYKLVCMYTMVDGDTIVYFFLSMTHIIGKGPPIPMPQEYSRSRYVVTILYCTILYYTILY